MYVLTFVALQTVCGLTTERFVFVSGDLGVGKPAKTPLDVGSNKV